MNKKTEKVELPSLGISLPKFKAAVDALVKLRDSGKFLVFLGRRSYVKLIGDPKEFQLVFSDIAKQEIAQEEATSALEEIGKYCSAWAGVQNAENLINFLEHAVYDDEFEKHKRHKANLKKQLKDKIELVSEKLFTPAMKQRARRMKSATSACLEDVDVEVVQDRRDNLSDQTVEEPFLRLRVRYSDGSKPSGPMPFFVGQWVRWGSPTVDDVSSFEIECDESDIDLLITRLIAAKEFLIKSAEMSADKQPA